MVKPGLITAGKEMKLDFLDDITDGGKYPGADPNKLLRLYDFDHLELTKMKQAIERNLVAGRDELVISNLDFIQPINCTLTFQFSEQDVGIKFPPDYNNSFLGRFSTSSYSNMLGIIDRLRNGYNWLYDPSDDSQIDLLLSYGGSW